MVLLIDGMFMLAVCACPLFLPLSPHTHLGERTRSYFARQDAATPYKKDGATAEKSVARLAAYTQHLAADKHWQDNQLSSTS